MQQPRAVDPAYARPDRLRTQLAHPARQSSESRSRFSWMTTPIEDSPTAEAQVENVLNFRKLKTQAAIPPLPTLPEHLAHLQTQNLGTQGKLSVTTPDPTSPEQYPIFLQVDDSTTQYVQSPEPTPYVVTQQGHSGHLQQQRPQAQNQQQPQFVPQQQHLYETSPISEASQYQYERLQHPDTDTSDRTATMASMQVNLPRSPMCTMPGHMLTSISQWNEEEAKSPLPKDRGYQTLSPEPISPPSIGSPCQYPINIQPDTNPLTPTSPRIPQLPRSQATTNIAVITPGQPAQMAFVAPNVPFDNPQASCQGGAWHHSFFSCAAPSICLSSLLCPCLIYGRTQYRLSAMSSGRDPTNMLGFSAFNGSCLAWSLLPGINILLTTIQHMRVSKVYGMDESAGGMGSACTKSMCCCCCVIAQDEKEMRRRGGKNKQRTTEEEGYRTVGEMRFAPPP